jgi:hypothetical protein
MRGVKRTTGTGNVANEHFRFAELIFLEKSMVIVGGPIHDGGLVEGLHLRSLLPWLPASTRGHAF